MFPSATRLVRLTSRTLSLAIVPCVVFAFWDNYFFPLAIKEVIVLAMGLLTFLLWWASGAGGGNGSEVPNPLGRPLAYLCLWSLLTIYWTGPKALAFHHWTTFAGLLIAIPAVFDFGRCSTYRKTYRNLLIVVGTLLLILASFQLNGISLGGWLRVMGGSSRTRVSLTVGHNNGVAPVILLTSFLALGAMVETKRKTFRFALFLTAIASWILIVFFLLTRSTILGLFAGGLLLVALNLYRVYAGRESSEKRKTSPWAKRLLLGGLAILIFLVCLAGVWVVRGGQIEGTYNPNLARNLTDRLRTLNPRFLMVDSRARLWTIGALMMRHHPMLGLGYSSAKYDYPFYQALFYEYHPSFPSNPTPNHTERLHNDYLQWMAETGAVGTILLLWCLMVFGKSVLLWMRSARKQTFGKWFGGSCMLVACLVPLLDACFSFPAHIAPIAVYVPGLLLLWFAHLSSRSAPKEKEIVSADEERREGRQAIRATGWGFPARLSLAVAVWGALALPLGMTEGKAPWISRTGVWSPILAQVHGRYFHGRMSAVREEFRELLKSVGIRLRDGLPVSRHDILFALQACRDIREQYLEYPPVLPFAGDTLYNAGSALDTVNTFYRRAGKGLLRSVRALGPGSPEAKFLREELEASVEFLPLAEDFYTRSLQNYRYHDLYRRIGRAQLDLAQRSTIPSPQFRQNLIRSGRRAFEIARRIFHTDEQLFLEIDVALRDNDQAAADYLIGKLVTLAPVYLRFEALPEIPKRGIRIDAKTGRKFLNLYTQEFLRLLLPHLGPEHASIYGVILTILDGAGADDLIETYARAGERIQEPYDRLFVDFRMLGEKSEFKDLNDELDDYDRYKEEEELFGPDRRVFYLSDLQRFSPRGTESERWNEEASALLQFMDKPLPQVVGRRCLAQADWERGETLECWRRHLEAHARTNTGNSEFVYERRANAFDTRFLGVGWPLLLP